MNIKKCIVAAISILVLLVLIFNLINCSLQRLSVATHNIDMYKKNTYIPDDLGDNDIEENRYDSAIKVSQFLPTHEDLDDEAYVTSLVGSGVGELTKKVGGAIKLHNLSKKSPGFIKATVLDTIEVAGKHRNAIKNLSWAKTVYPQLPEALLGKTIPQAFNSTAVGLAGYGTMGAVYGFK